MLSSFILKTDRWERIVAVGVGDIIVDKYVGGRGRQTGLWFSSLTVWNAEKQMMKDDDLSGCLSELDRGNEASGYQ